jgi:pimeloyl-[acyl-carrier protein] methyl ester esterase
MTALVFIHGFATGPGIWQKQISAFENATTDLSAIDSLDAVVLVGWSMGGLKALDVWQAYPNKVKGLVLVSSFPKYVKSPDYPFGTPEVLLNRLENKFLADYKTGMRYFYGLMFKHKQQLEMIDQLPVPEKKEIEKWFNKLRNEDKRDLLKQINIPVLIIHGNQDLIVDPQTAYYLKEHIKNAQLEIFPGAGHVPFIEEPGRFNLILRDFA